MKRAGRLERLSFHALGFGVAAAYWPGIAGAASTPRWAVIALGVPALLLLFPPAQARGRSGADWMAGILLIWAIASLTWSASMMAGVGELIALLVLAMAWRLGADVKDIGPVYDGFAFGMALNAVVALAQTLGFEGIEQTAAPGGLFLNCNAMGNAAALAVPMALRKGRAWMLPGIALALVLSSSRLSIAAVGVMLVVTLWRDGARLASVGLAGLAMLAVGLLCVIEPGKVGSAWERIALWHDTLSGLTAFGHGLGSFRSAFPALANDFDLTASRPIHPHSELLWLGFETGVAGLVMAAALIFTALGRFTLDRAILTIFAMEAVFGFALHNPATAFIAALALGHCVVAGRAHGEPVDRRRASLCAGVRSVGAV